LQRISAATGAPSSAGKGTADSLCGACRATVYALISELDEWLASSKPDEPETADEELSAPLPTSAPLSAPLSVAVKNGTIGTRP